MDVTEILMTVIGAIATVLTIVITSVVVPWIKSKTTAEQQSILTAAARAAVLFVQQTMKSASGEEKLEAAVNTVSAYFEKYNMAISADVLVAEIESELKALKIEAGDAWTTA